MSKYNDFNLDIKNLKITKKSKRSFSCDCTDSLFQCSFESCLP
ncbi:hypothetical protein PV797_12375 [Clostridiaceae bacterium M8S5]|nr:hypothetical protein PV797_12375 [Clostridiaceae bacterium M8S5]